MSFNANDPKLPSLHGLPSLSSIPDPSFPTLSGVPSLSSISNPIGFTGEKHPEVFDRPPKGPRKRGQLSKQQLNEYYTKGYTVVQNFFTQKELEPVCKSIEGLVDELANRLYSAGKILKLYQELGFYERLTAIEREFPGANMILLKTGKLTPAMQTLASHDLLLNLIEDIIGQEIAFSPLWNLRTKTPQNVATVLPWHQDSAYFDNDIYKVHVISAWIPLINATIKNGTMQMIPGCHKDAFIAKHNCCSGTDFYVYLEDNEIERSFGCNPDKACEVLEVPMGSFILFNNFTPHNSIMNTSQQIRWALDFRWQKAGTPAGSFGLKETLLLRTQSDPDYKPNWEAFNSVDRNKKQLSVMKKSSNEFSTEISGPWMNKWPIINHNRHTAAFIANSHNNN